MSSRFSLRSAAFSRKRRLRSASTDPPCRSMASRSLFTMLSACTCCAACWYRSCRAPCQAWSCSRPDARWRHASRSLARSAFFCFRLRTLACRRAFASVSSLFRRTKLRIATWCVSAPSCAVPGRDAIGGRRVWPFRIPVCVLGPRAHGRADRAGSGCGAKRRRAASDPQGLDRADVRVRGGSCSMNAAAVNPIRGRSYECRQEWTNRTGSKTNGILLHCPLVETFRLGPALHRIAGIRHS